MSQKPKNVHKCPQCDVTKTNTNDIKDHIIAVHGEGFICNQGGVPTKHSATKKIERTPEVVSPGGVQISVY